MVYAGRGIAIRFINKILHMSGKDSFISRVYLDLKQLDVIIIRILGVLLYIENFTCSKKIESFASKTQSNL